MRKVLWSIIIGLLVAIVWLRFSPLGASTPFVRDIPITLNQLPIPNAVPTLTAATTVLFMGTDVVYDGQGKHLKADRVALNGRSDTMMLVFFNPLHNTVSVMHIPRDTEVSIGKYGVQKINSANAIGGPEYAKTAVTTLLGVGIDHYVVMNIQALVQLVNELGGVTVEVPKKMSYMDWTGKLKIDLTPGVHTLTGNQAMGFVRFRHDELGDIGRVQRQQLFLHATSRKMMDPRSWLHVPALLDIAKKNIDTDMDQMQILQALNFAHSVPKDKIKFVMLPGQFSPNGDWIASWEARTIAMRLANPDQETASSRRNISICVNNATTDPAFGWKVAQALRKLGYVVSVGKDDKEAIGTRTRIIAQNGNTVDANMLRADLGDVGEVLNASIGNLTTSMTLIAHNDIVIDGVKMSSADAPYVVPPPQPPPLITMSRTRRKSKTDSMNTADLEAPDSQAAGGQESDLMPVENSTPPQELPDRPIADTPMPIAPDAVEAKPSAEGNAKVGAPSSSSPPPPIVQPVPEPTPPQQPQPSESPSNP